MKQMTKIISIIILFTISSLTFLFMDFYEASYYLKLKDFQIENMSIKYDGEDNSFSEVINEIQTIAEKHNVILIKSNVDNIKENSIKVYISAKNIDELCELLSKNFKVDILDNEKNDNSFISTFNHENNDQIGIIDDLFEDHFYTYYLMDTMIEKNDGLFGNYSILYTDFQNYSNFMNEINELLGYNTYSTSFSNNVQNYIAILLAGSLIFLLLFYFIFQVYEYYNNSKKIGCMKLLGFDIKRINKNMNHKNIKIYFASLIIMLLLSMLFIKNIKFNHLLILILINLFIILIEHLISYISCKIINKSHKMVNILKMENVTLKISKVSYKFKSIMTVLLICFSVIAFDSVINLYDRFKIYNDSKNLLEYSMFQSYIVDQPEVYDFDKQHSFYLDLVNNFETIYAEFHDYSQYTEEDWKNLKKSENEGTLFIYDSIDKNYLKREKIKIYDLNDNEINPDSINSVYFLFPKSKKELINSFEIFHSEINDYYLQFNSDYIFKAYLYDEQLLDTYQIDYKYIDSPILRVIDDSIKYPSFYDGLGISFFGEGMRTGLKIKLIDGDKEKTIQMLEKYIEKSGLSNLFSRKSFITYKEYFNDEILTFQLALVFISLAITLILIVYILISFQLLKLYIKSQKKSVLVKKMLGFENNNIFENLYKKNMKNTLISIIISLIILIFMKRINISFIFIPTLFLGLDLLITLISIKSTNFSTIHSDLKGGNYD